MLQLHRGPPAARRDDGRRPRAHRRLEARGSSRARRAAARAPVRARELLVVLLVRVALEAEARVVVGAERAVGVVGRDARGKRAAAAEAAEAAAAPRRFGPPPSSTASSASARSRARTAWLSRYWPTTMPASTSANTTTSVTSTVNELSRSASVMLPASDATVANVPALFSASAPKSERWSHAHVRFARVTLTSAQPSVDQPRAARDQ